MPEKDDYHIANYMAKEQDIFLNKTPIKEKLDLKIEKLPRELVEIAEKIARISGTWNPVEIYTPDSASVDAEKAKVMDSYDQGVEYNPEFNYKYANSLNLSVYRQSLMHEMHKLRTFGSKKKHFWQRHDKLGGKLTLDRGTRLFRTALYFKIKDDLATCDLVDGIKTKNEEKISAALKQKYPGTDEALYDMAVAEYVRLTHDGEADDEKIDESKAALSLKEIEWLKNKTFDAAGIAEAFKWALKECGLLRTSTSGKGFRVVIESEATGIDVRDKSPNGPTVFIPKDRKMNGRRLLGLIAHEIEGHARQSANGEELFFLGGGRLKIDNEQMYEGLGLRNEKNIEKKLFGAEHAAPSPFYVFATRMAEEGASFYKIFEDQVDRRLRVALKKPTEFALPPKSEIDEKVLKNAKEDAWKNTYRVMRGHIDMTNPKKYAMAKDLGYMRGYMLDRQLLNNDLGFLNEEGVIASGALAMMAELKLSAEKMPYPFLDVATKYWNEVLKPQMTAGIPQELKKAA